MADRLRSAIGVSTIAGPCLFIRRSSGVAVTLLAVLVPVVARIASRHRARALEPHCSAEPVDRSPREPDAA